MIVEEGNWRTRGACRDYDPEWWFATGDGNPLRKRAQRICQTACPVRAQCTEWALRAGVEYGTFGGITAKNRNAMLRRSGRRRRVQPERVRRVTAGRARLVPGSLTETDAERGGRGDSLACARHSGPR